MRKNNVWLSAVFLFLWAGPALAAKVIMKDGKIYEGKILGENEGDVIIKTNPVDRPRLLESEDILSVVRDPEVKPVRDPQRYATVELLPTGHFYSSNNMTLDPTAGLWIGGGLRWHPFVELGAGFDWRPLQSGELAVTDGTTTRGYESFGSYSGGFSFKLFPFYRWKEWKAEPYFLVGYEWSRLFMKGTDDALKGEGFKGGVGASWPLKGNFFLDTRFVYRAMSYDRIFFLQRDGSLDPAIRTDTYSTSLGIAYRF